MVRCCPGSHICQVERPVCRACLLVMGAACRRPCSEHMVWPLARIRLVGQPVCCPSFWIMGVPCPGTRGRLVVRSRTRAELLGSTLPSCWCESQLGRSRALRCPVWQLGACGHCLW